MFYWRLLAHDPELAKEMVCSEKPVIKDDSEELDQAVLMKLIPHIGSLASLLHKPPEVFISSLKAQAGGFNFKNLDSLGEEFSSDEEEEYEEEEQMQQMQQPQQNQPNLLDFDMMGSVQPQQMNQQMQQPQQQRPSAMSLFDMPSQPQQQQPQNNMYGSMYGNQQQGYGMQQSQQNSANMLFGAPSQPQQQPQQANKPAIDLSFLGI